MKNKKLFRSLSKRIEARNDGEAADAIFGGNPVRNLYFGRISAVCRVSEFLFLFAFIIFTVISAILNAGSITYDKAEYVIRNFAFRFEKNADTSTEIIYTPDEMQSFALFGQGLAVSGNSGIRIFSATGRNTCRSDYSLSSSRLASSSKFAAVYEFGGREYLLFNSFARVGRGTSEQPILGMSVSDSGSYIIVCGDDEYASSVLLYRSNFTLRSKFRKNSYVISSEISRDGGEILITTLDVNSSGQYISVIEKYEEDAEEPGVTVRLTGVFPYRCFFTDDGFGLLCKDRLMIYSREGDLKKELSFDGFEAVMFDSRGTACGVILKETGTGLSVNFHLRLIQTAVGQAALEERLDFVPTSLSVWGESAFLLSGGTVYEYRADGAVRSADVSKRPEGSAVIAYAEGKAYLLCRSSAYVVDLD
ncbi:MAG: hypothetical protein ILP01_02910 [Clostridia bacterium]|nr:hypothetical protein [Clostridia bacterium]